MKIEFTNRSRKELGKLDQVTRKRIIEKLEMIRRDPHSVRIKKRKSIPGQRVFRSGNYRVSFIIDYTKSIMYIKHILHRREAYRK